MDLKTVYAALSAATEKLDAGTFMRGGNSSSSIINSTFMTVGARYAETVRDILPASGVVVVRVAPFDGAHTTFTPLQLADRQQVLKTGMECLQRAWSTFFGNSFVESTRCATQLPQSVKDLLATAFKAIDDSSLSSADKQVAKHRLISNIMLRGITPLITSATIDDKEKASSSKSSAKPSSKPTREMNAVESMRELGTLMQTIGSGVSPGSLNQKGAYTNEVVAYLTTRAEPNGMTRLEIMQHNMYQMFFIAAAQGTPLGT